MTGKFLCDIYSGIFRTDLVYVCSIILNDGTTIPFISGRKFLTNTIYHCKTHQACPQSELSNTMHTAD